MIWKIKSEHTKVAVQFLQTYLHLYENRRYELITQYCENSVFTFNGTDYTESASIIKKLKSLPDDSHFVIKTIDSVPAYNNILPVFVIGEFHTGNNTQPIPFSQAFQLLRIRRNYFILNHFLRVEIDQDVYS